MILSPSIAGWVGWVGRILVAASASSTSPATASAVASTASSASVASFGLGITSDVGEGFKFGTAVTNFAAQKSAQNNTPAMEQAAVAAKVQALKDYAAACLAHAEATGDLSAVRLLLS